jgi:hypothetical protein
VLPTAVIHIPRTVLVAEHELVDGLRAVHDLVDERFAQIILERTRGIVGHGYTDAADLALVHVIRAEKEEILAVLLHDGGRPQSVTQPLYARVVDNALVLGPLHQILRRKTVEVELLAVRRRIGGIDPIGVAEHHALGIGVTPLENGVARSLLRRCTQRRRGENRRK